MKIFKNTNKNLFDISIHESYMQNFLSFNNKFKYNQFKQLSFNIYSLSLTKNFNHIQNKKFYKSSNVLSMRNYYSK